MRENNCRCVLYSVNFILLLNLTTRSCETNATPGSLAGIEPIAGFQSRDTFSAGWSSKCKHIYRIELLNIHYKY